MIIMSMFDISYPGWARLHLISSTSIFPGNISILKTYSWGNNLRPNIMMSKTLSLFQAGYPQVSMFPVFPNPNGIHLVHHDNLRAGLQSMPKYPALQIKVWHWHQIVWCIYHNYSLFRKNLWTFPGKNRREICKYIHTTYFLQMISKCFQL